MAIKGKSRRRSRTKGVHAPPKPQITPRKLSPWQRPDLRRGLAVALGLFVLLGGLRVWQNSARADSLRSYIRALKTAEAPYLAHVGNASPTALDKKVRDFTQAQVGVADFKTLVDRWEKDFGEAKTGVSKLVPPGPLRQAQQWILEGLDGFAGVARLLNVAVQQREFADQPAQKALQQKLENQVQVVIQHANEWLGRARAVYQHGVDLINDYRSSWHVTEQVTSGAAVPEIPS